MQARFENVRQKLSVHFLAKNVTECEDFILHGVPTFSSENAVYERHVSVDECTPKKENLTSDQLAEKFVAYPVNRARNVARKFATTKYILSADLDHHFSDQFEAKMLELAEQTLKPDAKTVLVYRIFEVSKKVTQLPKNKADLLKLYIEGTAQEFHKYYGAHAIPKLYEWFMHEGEMGVQFYRPWVAIFSSQKFLVEEFSYFP
jgi:hypothetical protein